MVSSGISSPRQILPLVDFTMNAANRTKVADTYEHRSCSVGVGKGPTKYVPRFCCDYK